MLVYVANQRGIYMYNERNSEFSIRDIVLQLLFVVLFVFILLWLFQLKQI